MFDPDDALDLPSGWEWGDDGDSVICPCGDAIELDGICPDSHRSPLLGLI
jgi:hypothetical protein